MSKAIRVWVGIAAAYALTGCFGDNSAKNDSGSPPPDATADVGPDASSQDAIAELQADASARDATVDTASDSPSSEASVGTDGSDGASEAGCPKSTCTSIEVKFIGWVPGTDGGNAACEIRVDDVAPDGGSVYVTTSANDPAVAGHNALVGNFVTGADGGPASPLQYVNDNNACDVPDFVGRRNGYYLSPGQALLVQPLYGRPCSCGGGNCPNACDDAGTGGLCDFTSGFYSQTCPNFGFNCVDTPQRIEQIVAIATNADPTCEVCIYSSPSPTPGNLVKCIAAGKSASKADFVADGGAAFPALVRLDDGTNCAAY